MPLAVVAVSFTLLVLALGPLAAALILVAGTVGMLQKLGKALGVNLVKLLR